MPKQCEEFELNVVQKPPYKLVVSIKPFNKDLWSGFRLLSKIGKKLQEDTKREYGVIMYSGIGNVEAVFTPETKLVEGNLSHPSSEELVDASHTLYLWLEHPEKY